MLTIALGITTLTVIISGETEAQRGTELLVATPRASGRAPSSSTDAFSCDHPSRPCCRPPGKNKKQICNSAAYKTINTVQGCGDTIIIRRSETWAIYVSVYNQGWEMCLQRCSEISSPLYFERPVANTAEDKTLPSCGCAFLVLSYLPDKGFFISLLATRCPPCHQNPSSTPAFPLAWDNRSSRPADLPSWE